MTGWRRDWRNAWRERVFAHRIREHATKQARDRRVLDAARASGRPERYAIARIYADGHREAARNSFAALEEACCYALGMADELGKHPPQEARGRPESVEVRDGETIKLSVRVVTGGLVPWSARGLFPST
jgi:hypothetical protein